MDERLAVNSFVEKILVDAIPRHFLDISIDNTKENASNFDLQNSAQRNSAPEKYDFTGITTLKGSSLDNIDDLINNCLDSVAFGVNRSLSPKILSKCLQMGGGNQDQEYLKRNMLIPVRDNPFMCSVCGLEFENQIQVTDHSKMHRYNKRTFDSAFNINNLGIAPKIEIIPLNSQVSGPANKTNTTVHNANLKSNEIIPLNSLVSGPDNKTNTTVPNTDLKSNECSECGKSLSSIYGLKRHKLTHLPIKPFNCRVCGKGFTERSKLKIHLYTHANIRPFECSECNSSFREKNRLVKHMKIHSDQKDFKCNECGKLFVTGYSLKRHTMVHEDNKKNNLELLNNKSITLERL